MAVRLYCLCLLLVLLVPSQAKKQQCFTSNSKCDECIQSGPECAWCTAPNSNVRCHTVRGLRRAGCPKAHIYNPQGGVQVVKNGSSTEPRLTGSAKSHFQEISLRLRPGVRQSFNLTFTAPTGQPMSEIIMDTRLLPAGVNITYRQIVNGNPAVIEVNVEATLCISESDNSDQMQNRTGPWSVHIMPSGLLSQSVKLEISLECQCDCTRNHQGNSPDCSGRGALVCGQCECNEPYSGRQSQTDDYSVVSLNEEDFCRLGPNAPVCSGRGECMSGVCICHSRVNQEERYSGMFCECSNFDCPRSNNRLCGGQGRCECGRCICDDGWTGEDCSCSLETVSCMASNQMLCRGRGICMCGTCKCEPPYSGPTCEDCPTCRGACQEYRECAECRAFGTGRKKEWCDRECSDLSLNMVDTKHKLTQRLCVMRSQDDDCLFYYTVSRATSRGQLTVARAKECPQN